MMSFDGEPPTLGEFLFFSLLVIVIAVMTAVCANKQVASQQGKECTCCGSK